MNPVLIFGMDFCWIRAFRNSFHGLQKESSISCVPDLVVLLWSLMDENKEESAVLKLEFMLDRKCNIQFIFVHFPVIAV